MEGINLPNIFNSCLRMLDLLYYIDSDDVKTASLFLPIIDFSKCGSFITNFLETSQNNTETRDFRWRINCLLANFLNSQDSKSDEKNFTFHFQPEIENEYIDDFFKSSKDQIVSFILPFLNTLKTPKPNEIHNLSFYTIVFSESYPGIFDCIYYPKFKHLLYEVITIPKLYELLSTDFLYILKEPPTEFLRTAPIDLSDAPLFFKSAINYEHLDLTLMLQKRFSLESQYPNSFPQVFNGNFYSLLNTSLVSEESFFDIISHLVLEHLTLGEFIEISSVDMSFFEPNDVIRIIPYILCAYQQPLYADLTNAIKLIDILILKNKTIKQSLSNQSTNTSTTNAPSGGNLSSFVDSFKNSFASKKLMISKSSSNFNLNQTSNENLIIHEKSIEIMIDLLQRFKNDQELSSFISSSSSVETDVNDLTNMSIPKHLFSLISRKEIITQWSNKTFYLISDEERNADFDFIRGYIIFLTFIPNYPVPQGKVGLMKNVYDFTNEISNLLKDMKDSEIRKSICIDLFSILFLRSNGKFLISINYAKAILSVLAANTDCSYISEAYSRVSKVNTKTNNDFNSLFVRDPKDFFNAIENKKYQTAYDFSKSGIFANLFILSYSIYLISSKMQIPITAVEFTDLLNFEINLSVNDEGFLLQNNSNKNKIKEKFLTHLGGNSESFISEIPTVQFEIITELEETINNYADKFGIEKEKLKEMLTERESLNCLRNIEFNVADDEVINKIKNGLANEETWKYMTEFVKSFDLNQINGSKVNELIQKSNSLLNFILYLNKYYNFCMLQPNINPDSIFDEFDIFLPLTAIVHSGNIEKAEEFCKFLKINLFDTVIQNLDKFYITQSFFEFYENKHPLEVKAMKMVNDIENKKNVNLNEDDYFSQNQIIYEIIDKVKLNEKIDYDEIGFYKIDHQYLYKLLITNNAELFSKYDKSRRYSNYYQINGPNKNDNKSFNSAMINLLKMVDYIAPEEDYEMIDAIYFDDLKKTQNLKDNKSIIDYYLKIKDYNKALNLVRTSNNNSELFELLLKVHDDLEFVDHLFFFFPKKFVLLAKRFSQYENILPIILKYSPKDKKRNVEGFVNLSPKIRENCRIFDEESLIDAFKKFPEEIFTIKEINHSLFNDDIKLQIIQNLALNPIFDSTFNIVEFNKYVNYLFPLFDTQTEIVTKWKKVIYSWINSIVIKSIENEEKAILGIDSIYYIINNQKSVLESFTDKATINISEPPKTLEILALYEFLHIRLFQRYSIEYNFSQYGKDNNQFFSDYLLSLIYKFDLYQFDLELLREAFDADVNNLVVHRVKSQIQLGLIQEARRTIQNYSNSLKTIKKLSKTKLNSIKQMPIQTTEFVSRTQMKDYLLNNEIKTQNNNNNNKIKRYRSSPLPSTMNQQNEEENNENDDDDDNRQTTVFVDNFHEFMHLNIYRSSGNGSNLFLYVNLEHPFYSIFMHRSVYDTDFILTSFYPKEVNNSNSSQNVENQNVDIGQESIEKYKNLSYNFLNYINEVAKSKQKKNNNNSKLNEASQNNNIASLLKFQLRFYATSYSSIPSALLILNSTGNFDSAYQVLMSIQNQIKRHNYFVLHFYPASFFYPYSITSTTNSNAIQQRRLMSSASMNKINLENKSATSSQNLSKSSDQQKKVSKKEIQQQQPSSSPSKKETQQQQPSSSSSPSKNGKTVTFSPSSDNINLKMSPKPRIARQRLGSTQNPTRILTFLKSQDTESILTPGLIASLIFFLEEKQMYTLLMSLSLFTNRLEDSAIAAIHAFANNHGNQNYIDHAINCLSKTLLMRQNKIPIPTNPDGTAQLSVFSRDENLQSIMLLKEKAVLQREILTFFNEKKVVFNEDYDILNNKNVGTMNCSTFSLLNFNFAIFEKIRKLMANEFKVQSLIRMLAVELSKKDSNSIDKFFDFYEVKYAHLKNKLLPCLLRELSMNKNWQDILRLILLVPSPMERLYYFIEFDFVVEALGIILSPDQNKEMLGFLPYIAHRVASIGDTDLFANLSGLV